MSAIAACVGTLTGCGMGSEGEVASSGSPEADRRADMRVGGGGSRERDNRTLYERLGGAETIAALVDDITERTISDPRVNFDRSKVKNNWLGGTVEPWANTPANVEKFKQHMREFLTLAAGGPAKYTGRDMGVVHKGMRITNSEFDAMVGDVKTSLDRLEIGNRETREVLAIIETTRKQIVEKQ